MKARLWIAICLSLILPQTVVADDRLVRLFVPDTLVRTGLLKHILPRFSLKTQVRVETVAAPETADLVIGQGGRAIFEGAGQVWKMEVPGAGHPGTDKLADWLRSDVGQRTIASYAPDGTTLFGPARDTGPVVATLSYDGNAEQGHAVALAKCTRCHAVDDQTAWSSIGSTPSFGVLRTLSNWEERFTAFYVLKPHAAFTQITDVTDPFPVDRPSPIAPIELTLDEVEALVAYVAAMPAADLGRPLDHQ